MKKTNPVDQEIRRLSLVIAVAQNELKIGVLYGTPLAFLSPLCQEIAICQLQRSALRDGRFKDLPYNVKILYSTK